MQKSINRNYLTTVGYTSANEAKLEEVRISQGYKSDEWLTFLQAKDCGGDVLIGEKGVRLTKIIFDKDDPKVIVGYKKFVVFNSEQCKNLDSDLKLNQEELEIYKTLRGDGSDLTRKALAKTSKNLAV